MPYNQPSKHADDAAIAIAVKERLVQELQANSMDIFHESIFPLYFNQGDALPSLNEMAEHYFPESYERSPVIAASAVSLICKARHREVLANMSEDEISAIYQISRHDSETFEDFLDRIVEEYAKTRAVRVAQLEIQGRVDIDPDYFTGLAEKGREALGNFAWNQEREDLLFNLVQKPEYQTIFKDGSSIPNWESISRIFSEQVGQLLSDTAVKSKYYLLLDDPLFLNGRADYYIPKKRFPWESYMGLIDKIINSNKGKFKDQRGRVNWREVIKDERLSIILEDHGFDLSSEEAVVLMIKHLSKAYLKHLNALRAGEEA